MEKGRSFEKSFVSQLRRVGWIFDIISSPQVKSEQNGNVQILFYINSNCVFSNTIPLWGQLTGHIFHSEWGKQFVEF